MKRRPAVKQPVMKRAKDSQRPQRRLHPRQHPSPRPKVSSLAARGCRGTARGCSQCRNSKYTGPRMNRATWLKLGLK